MVSEYLQSANTAITDGQVGLAVVPLSPGDILQSVSGHLRHPTSDSISPQEVAIDLLDEGRVLGFILKKGFVYYEANAQQNPLTWTGQLRMPEQYQMKARLVFFNRTGITLNGIITVIIDRKVK